MNIQNENKISWCNVTINPVIGCKNRCPYCYAKKINDRFHIVPDFSKPQFFPERLKQFNSKKPKSIFINSMSDIAFWTPKQLKETITAMIENSQHKYIALTKNFMKYLTIFAMATITQDVLSELKGLFYVGETITKQDDIRLNTINGISVSADFINIEPILEPVDLFDKLIGDTVYRQIVIGAETGNRKGKVVPEKQWIDGIVRQADERGIRVFMKESLKDIMGKDFRQDKLLWEE